MTGDPARADAVPASAAGPTDPNPRGKRLAFLTLAALGIVYGDIGTSPLYAIQECFNPERGIEVTQANVYGILSLILWALLLVVSVKYCVFILRADNRGEGGILALLALAVQRPSHRPAGRALLIAMGLIGAALLYGDGIITPAISVLGAAAGLTVISPAFERLVLPIAIGLLIALFLVQRLGTARVGSAFGPITAIWFLTIGTLGIAELVRTPEVLFAMNPLYGVRFLVENRWIGFTVLGAVLLVITGSEALFADLGHLGKRPIRVGWFGLALPCLLLNYFGQGALLLRSPEAVVNPFYMLAPPGFLYPLLAIATAAAIVASQAMISGTFSITQQCVQLGYAPRVTITHTSAREAGQIYIPEVNNALMIGCLAVTVAFGSATALGGAYGIAVMGTMSMTCTLFAIVAMDRFGWRRWQAGLFLAVFLTVDLAFLAAAMLKVPSGGWFPLVVGAAIFAMMTTWKRGRQVLREKMSENALPLEIFMDDLTRSPRIRVSGTAIFMTSEPTGVPTVLLHHLKHNKVLHDQVILLSIMPLDVPYATADERLQVEPLDHGFFRVVARYGFMETPDVKEVLSLCAAQGVRTRPLETSYYLGRERIIPRRRKRGDRRTRLALWRKKLFGVMTRNAIPATQYFGLPPNRVVELGTQVEM
jgi:KUP system potassium uptake protein